MRVLLILCAIPLLAQVNPVEIQTAVGVWMAMRYDDTHVVFLYADGYDNAEWKEIRDATGRHLPAPAAKYPAGAGPWVADRGREGAPVIGTELELLIGGSRIARATVESYVSQATCSNVGRGLLARVDDLAFRDARAKYYVIRRPSSNASGTAWRVTLPRAVSLDKSRVNQVLKPLVAAEVDRRGREPKREPRSRAEAAFLALRDRAEQQLISGDTSFWMDAQAVPVDSAGTIRYFVRAAWIAGNETAALATAWLKPDLSLAFLEHVETTDLEIHSYGLGVNVDTLPKILNVIERDGATEFVRFTTGLEAGWVVLDRYTPAGLEPTSINYSWGC